MSLMCDGAKHVSTRKSLKTHALSMFMCLDLVSCLRKSSIAKLNLLIVLRFTYPLCQSADYEKLGQQNSLVQCT